jgi:hypothetical protein
LQVGTITLTRPPASVTRHLTHDIIVDVNTVIDGKMVGGFSFLLARANSPVPKPMRPEPNRTISRRAGQAVPPPHATPQKKFEMTVPLSPTAAHQSIVEYLVTQKVRILQNDPQRGLISSAGIPLTRQALLASITPVARELVPPSAAGRYFVSFKTTRGGGEAATSHIEVSTRIIVLTSQDLDSPLGGRLVPSNGSIEQRYLGLLTTRLRAR